MRKGLRDWSDETMVNRILMDLLTKRHTLIPIPPSLTLRWGGVADESAVPRYTISVANPRKVESGVFGMGSYVGYTVNTKSSKGKEVEVLR